MTEAQAPQLYLIAPAGITADRIGPLLEAALARLPVACIRLSGAGDEAELGRLADAAREIAHAADIALVIEDHIALAQAHGLDGVHLTDGARGVRAARKALGADAIVGAFCGASRHDGLNAAEAGADYVSFGPVGETALGHGERAALELFEWWSEVIEVPIVAEGALDAALIAELSPISDFIALGPEAWAAPDPVAALAALWG